MSSDRKSGVILVNTSPVMPNTLVTGHQSTVASPSASINQSQSKSVCHSISDTISDAVSDAIGDTIGDVIGQQQVTQ